MNTDNNILLAEFLEFQKTDLGWFDSEGVLSEVEQDNCFDSLYFDTDWNWLMACVEKIEYLSKDFSYLFCVEICRDSCYIHQNDFDAKTLFCNSVPNNRLESCYLTIVQFVKWFNQQNNEKQMLDYNKE